MSENTVSQLPEKRTITPDGVLKKDHPPRTQRRRRHTPLGVKIAGFAGAAALTAFGGVKIADKVFSDVSSQQSGIHIQLRSPIPSLSTELDDKRTSQESAKLRIVEPNRKITENEIQKATLAVPKSMRQDARIAIPLIAQALVNEGFDSTRVFAFALACVEHESFFRAMTEIEGESQADEYEYSGRLYGRGYLQITGIENYDIIGKHLGLNLVENPDLLLDPEISAQALAAYFSIFGTGELAREGKFFEARRTINPEESEVNEEPFKSTPKKIVSRTHAYGISMN